MTKKWYLSKTLWIATLQAVAGVAVVFSTAYPNLGWLIITKSVVDSLLRLITTTELK